MTIVAKYRFIYENINFAELTQDGWVICDIRDNVVAGYCVLMRQQGGWHGSLWRSILDESSTLGARWSRFPSRPEGSAKSRKEIHISVCQRDACLFLPSSVNYVMRNDVIHMTSLRITWLTSRGGQTAHAPRAFVNVGVVGKEGCKRQGLSKSVCLQGLVGTQQTRHMDPMLG